MVTTLYLVRHCQAEGNLKMEYHGHTDGNVTEMGEKQLAALTGATGNWELSAIYASPLIRAQKTAAALNANYHLPIVTDDSLKEIYCGDWEGRSWDDIVVRYREEYIAWETHPEDYVSPGGESMRQAYERVVKTINGIVRKHPGEAVAVVAHSGIFRCYLAYAMFGELRNLNQIGWGDNTNISKITFDESWNPTVVYHYDASHLTPDISTLAQRKKNGVTRPCLGIK